MRELHKAQSGKSEGFSGQLLAKQSFWSKADLPNRALLQRNRLLPARVGKNPLYRPVPDVRL
jgi:hypothetical protein